MADYQCDHCQQPLAASDAVRDARGNLVHDPEIRECWPPEHPSPNAVGVSGP